MSKVTLQSILVDYPKYRKGKETKNNSVATASYESNYESNRQKLNEIMDVLGVDVKYFKENAAANQPYQFAETDKNLLFDILYQYTSDDLKKIRKGLPLEVPIETLTFYLDAFTTLLEHLEIDEGDIQDQREAIMKATQYKLAVELHATKSAMEGINKDIQQLLSDWDDVLLYEDRVVLLSDFSKQLRILQERFRHVYLYMDLERKNEAFEASRMDLKQRPAARDELKKQALLKIELEKNNEYVELHEQLDRLNGDPSFLKKKTPQYIKIFEDMTSIIEETQLRLFGEILPPREQSKMKLQSNDVLMESIKSYEELLIFVSIHSEKPMIVDVSYQDRFENQDEESD
ncbi:hypothetical protein [Paenibacillus sp. NPDC057934]|uniref:hypothetical protein n=1 Tax=Paenibacillus sp. NPDC057934 TaxID=3346282 RepID=UPI0036DE6033